jgi:hypothetical protein
LRIKEYVFKGIMAEFGRRKYRDIDYPQTLSEGMESVLSELDELRRALHDVQEGKYSANRDEEMSVIMNCQGGTEYCFKQLQEDLDTVKKLRKTTRKLGEYNL